MRTNLIVDFCCSSYSNLILTGIIVAYCSSRGSCTIALDNQRFIDVCYHTEKPEIFEVNYPYHCWPASLEEIK